ncbi:hypothetical protein [Bacteroidetes bacterium endosymbiont of Geopemphigus sp.]|uniref:hypothetical protein n=1 Tax=Bacteroidetes bacterium endosymbiont of Geopemphigus sp. TaxID=2047937 RepID=UPI000CD1AC2C|nr:hypothetical protein [Bacteroidetes bacterium endosymbiont of Geopemphigus sp.]
MLKFTQNKIFTFLIGFFFFGCFKDNDAPKTSYYSPPDLTAYMDIGYSITSGYDVKRGKSLLRIIQEVSYPKFIADQFQKVNPTLVFNQLLMDGQEDETKNGTSTLYLGTHP